MKHLLRTLATFVVGLAMIFGAIVAAIHVRQLLWAHWADQLAHDLQWIKLGETRWESPQMNEFYDRWKGRASGAITCNSQLPPYPPAPLRVPQRSPSEAVGCTVYFYFGEQGLGYPYWMSRLYLKLGGREELVYVELRVHHGVVTSARYEITVMRNEPGPDIHGGIEGSDAESVEKGWPLPPHDAAYQVKIPSSCNGLRVIYSRTTPPESLEKFFDINSACLATARCKNEKYLMRGLWSIAASEMRIDPNAEWPRCQW